MAAAAAVLAAPAASPAQDVHVRAAATAAAAITTVEPQPGTGRATELKVEQAVFMPSVSAWHGRLTLQAAINLEGISMAGGVLNPGAWGEGFVDRRHPHTYLHELMLSLTWDHVSLAAGKGFVPFGTDDPMNRPFLRFPANHHWSQVLERAVVTGAVRAGPAIVEAALFNGDEPEGPSQWPRVAGRFGDSWALRLSLLPAPGVEFQGSRAHVASPEHRPGAGTPHEKWSASVRVERPLSESALVYGLAEWARNTEAHGFFRFHSVLGEGSVRLGPHRLAYRLERTERPEEERSLNPFRSIRPHLEDTILGRSRWTIHTVGYTVRLSLGNDFMQAEPLVEVSRASVEDMGSGILRTAQLYGGTTVWSLTAGLRVHLGDSHRMGRYGLMERHPE